jgi:hypothetical protein
MGDRQGAYRGFSSPPTICGTLIAIKPDLRIMEDGGSVAWGENLATSEEAVGWK